MYILHWFNLRTCVIKNELVNQHVLTREQIRN